MELISWLFLLSKVLCTGFKIVPYSAALRRRKCERKSRRDQIELFLPYQTPLATRQCCALIPAFFAIFPSLSRSVAMNFTKSLSEPGAGSMPVGIKRSCNSFDFNAT
jgi:hypothetical protein